MEGRAVQSGFHQDQSELENSGNRRSRRPRRQALHRVRIGLDPDVSRRKNRKIPAARPGEEIRSATMVDVSAHRRWADVRPMGPLQAVLAQGQGYLLFDDALSDRSETALRGSGKTAGALALSRRRRIFD